MEYTEVVSDGIGHANVGFFLQTYAHVLGNDDRDAAEQAATFLLGRGGVWVKKMPHKVMRPSNPKLLPVS